MKMEFKRNQKSLILWTLIISFLAGLMLALFPAFEGTFAELEELLSSYPEGFLDAFGLGENGLNMDDIYGWFGVEGYLFVTLIGGSYAALLGSGILSKEEDEKTIEFLMTQPISRSHVFLSKSLVVLINLIIMNLVLSLILLIFFNLYGDTFDFMLWLLYSFAPLLLQLVLASIAILIGVFITKSRKVTSMSLGLSIGLYVLDIISKLTKEAEFLKYFTPYEYVNAVAIVNNNQIEPLYLGLSLIIIVSSILVSYRVYLKKDFNA
jgi:ABC-2 type transport system permease protein